MNKTILLIICLVSAMTNAQVQTRYYMNDIKILEYLTLNFCVDSIGNSENFGLL